MNQSWPIEAFETKVIGQTTGRNGEDYQAIVVDGLTVLVADRSRDDFVFPAPDGGVFRNGNWRRRVLDRAAAEAGIANVTPHILRHTAASLAISAAAHVKAVQRMLGHASAAMILDMYAGLFWDDLDAVADRMDAARCALVLPPATVSDPGERRLRR